MQKSPENKKALVTFLGMQKGMEEGMVSKGRRSNDAELIILSIDNTINMLAQNIFWMLLSGWSMNGYKYASCFSI